MTIRMDCDTYDTLVLLRTRPRASLYKGKRVSHLKWTKTKKDRVDGLMLTSDVV